MKKLTKCKGLLVVSIFNLIIFSLMLILVAYFLIYDIEMNNSGHIRFVTVFLISFFSLIGTLLKNQVGWALTGLPYMFLSSLFLFFIMPFNVDAIKAGIIVILIANVIYALLNIREVQEYFNINIVWLLVLNILVMGMGFLLAQFVHSPL